jgi:hypothetical protein
VQAGLVWASNIAETIFKWLEKGLETIVKTVQAGLVWASKIAETIFKWLEKGLETIEKTVEAGIKWVSDAAEKVISWISNGVEAVTKTVSAGMGWDSDTAEAIWGFISGAATITKDIIVNIIGNIDSWLAQFLGINTAGESKRIANEDAGAMAYAQSHGVEITATVNGKAGTGIKSLGKTNDLNAFSSESVKLNGKAGTGINKLGKTNDLNAFNSESVKLNGKAGTGINRLGKTNDLNAFGSESVKLNGNAGTGISSLGSKNTLNSFNDQIVKVSASSVGTNLANGLLNWLTGNNRGEATVKVNLTNGAGGTKWVAMTKALGGVLNNGFWKSLPQYARGTLNAGTLFAAGEAGPEVVGHIGGRTEVLNKSQLASTMFSAVENGMLSAIGRLRFRAPAMSTGSVLPYDIAAQIAATGASLETTLNANNEDLIQTIISVAGQIVAAVQHLNTGAGTPAGGLTPQQIINEINRRTQMFSASPLKGV